jgi:hypothetical protein
MEPASVAYRYRKFTLGKRCEQLVKATYDGHVDRRNDPDCPLRAAWMVT